MAAPSYAGTILVLGDSLSAAFGMAPERGWVHLLRKQLNPTAGQHRVINASISGETTAGGAARLGRLLERHQPTVVIIELGGNDGLRGVALRDSRVQLEFMIDLALRQNADVLLLGMRLPPNYGPTYTSRFLVACLTERNRLHSAPVFLQFGFEPWPVQHIVVYDAIRYLSLGQFNRLPAGNSSKIPEELVCPRNRVRGHDDVVQFRERIVGGNRFGVVAVERGAGNLS